MIFPYQTNTDCPSCGKKLIINNAWTGAGAPNRYIWLGGHSIEQNAEMCKKLQTNIMFDAAGLTEKTADEFVMASVIELMNNV
jgi:hypothetical protein